MARRGALSYQDLDNAAQEQVLAFTRNNVRGAASPQGQNTVREYMASNPVYARQIMSRAGIDNAYTDRGSSNDDAGIREVQRDDALGRMLADAPTVGRGTEATGTAERGESSSRVASNSRRTGSEEPAGAAASREADRKSAPTPPPRPLDALPERTMLASAGDDPNAMTPAFDARPGAISDSNVGGLLTNEVAAAILGTGASALLAKFLGRNRGTMQADGTVGGFPDTTSPRNLGAARSDGVVDAEWSDVPKRGQVEGPRLGLTGPETAEDLTTMRELEGPPKNPQLEVSNRDPATNRFRNMDQFYGDGTGKAPRRMPKMPRIR